MVLNSLAKPPATDNCIELQFASKQI